MVVKPGCDGLRAKKSTDRRRAAKELFSSGSSSCGPELLDALVWEIDHHREAWHTHFWLARALSVSRFGDAVPVLIDLVRDAKVDGMVGVSIGYAICRLNAESDESDTVIDDLRESGCHLDVYWGYVDAMNRLEVIPSEKEASVLVDIFGIPDMHQAKTSAAVWCSAVAAAVYWPYPFVHRWVQTLYEVGPESVRVVAEATLRGERTTFGEMRDD